MRDSVPHERHAAQNDKAADSPSNNPNDDCCDEGILQKVKVPQPLEKF